MTPREMLELADWRRRVAQLYTEWRAASGRDPAAATAAFRAAKDRLFAEHPQSPLLPDERATFRGLAYWPYDAAYRMTVRLDPPAEVPAAFAGLGGVPSAPTQIALPSSGPQAIAFQRVGRVEPVGPLAGQTLSVFWIDGYGGGIFMPFRDATSGAETYGAGRYALDTIKSADHGSGLEAGTLTLDFNMAYHPSCAYDPRWSCPLAPPENTLRVPVPVGERLQG